MFSLCSCLYSWAGAKDVVKSDIQAGRQCFSNFFFSRGFPSHGVPGISMVSGFQVSRNYRHQIKMKSR